MERLILDTDMLSEILRGRNPFVKLQKDRYAAHYRHLEFTSASAFEILYGLHRVNAHGQLKRAQTVFAINHEVVPTSDDYRLAAEICGALDRQGTPIGFIDPLIAACAIGIGYGVASGNTRHYEYIRRAGYAFHLEDWRVS